MERSILSSMLVVALANDEMMNVRGGDGATTPLPPVVTSAGQDIIL